MLVFVLGNLQDFQPAAIFIELSREDFFNVRTRLD